jgi:hypothetical protein
MRVLEHFTTILFNQVNKVFLTAIVSPYYHFWLEYSGTYLVKMGFKENLAIAEPLGESRAVVAKKIKKEFVVTIISNPRKSYLLMSQLRS